MKPDPIDDVVGEKLMTTYIIKKFIPVLEKELIFTRIAGPIKPMPWYRRTWYQVCEYFAHLWTALKGQRCLDD